MIIEFFLAMLGFYLAVGVVFALWFQLRGLRRVDPGTDGAGFVFRLLITPGIVALWPLLIGSLRRAAAGRETAGDAERPVSPRGLRTGHRRLAYLLLLLVPVTLIAALAVRTAPATATSPLPAAPAVLPQELTAFDTPFGELPARASLRGDAAGERQLAVDVAEDLEIPSLMLYWLPTGGDFPADARLLGPLWGPQEHRYRLPAADGTVIAYSLGHGERVAELSLTESGS